MLEAGFTTVRDVGNEGKFACASLRLAVSRGLGGTEVRPSSTPAGSSRPTADSSSSSRTRVRCSQTPEYFFADTRDELLKAVRENIHYGATVIKLVVDDQKYIYTPEDIRFVVDEAAKPRGSRWRPTCGPRRRTPPRPASPRWST